MLKNYFKIAWRTLLKNKAMFGLNIIGLGIGIATCLIITLFVIDELSYDRFFEKADNIVRVTFKAKEGGQEFHEAGVMAPIGATLKREFPEVIEATRLFNIFGEQKITFRQNTIRNGKMAQIDPNFFDVFSLRFLKGNPKTALSNTRDIILTEDMVETHFGAVDPIGKIINLDGYGSFTVSGVIENIPKNSHFQFDLFSSLANNDESKRQTWMSGSFHTYLVLDEKARIANLESKLPAIVEKYMGAEMKDALGMDFNEFKSSGNELGFYLLPLPDIHLFSEVSTTGDLSAKGDFKTVSMFAAIALFMLIIACINFMNLSTAGASKRMKEIGMRKVLGSAKRQLVFQFLSESFIATSMASAIGVLFMLMALPYFNEILGTNLNTSQLSSPLYITIFAVFVLVITVLSGVYPAFFMSSFNPLSSLKKRFTATGGKGVRSGLVIFQFSISVVLIIGTLVVSSQMDYIQNKDIGYQRNNLIVLRHAGHLGQNLNAFKTELVGNVGIESVTTSAFIPAGPTADGREHITTDQNKDLKIRSRAYNIDEEYIPTLNMEIVLGRNFSSEFGTEKNNVILNETAVKAFGLEGNVLGQIIYKEDNGARYGMTVVGVVKDFHTHSLHALIEPLLMQYNPHSGLIIKANTTDMSGLVSTIEEQWNSYETGETFQFAFLDELFNETYIKEANMNSVLRIFALLTIFVACLGLFGLVTFTAEQRFKEIGIRKTLGSSVAQIVGLLSKEFIKLILASFIIAFPLGYYFMNLWLQDFEYRIEVEWWVFGGAGLATVLIAFLTISYRSIKAALMNPVLALKSE